MYGFRRLDPRKSLKYAMNMYVLLPWPEEVQKCENALFLFKTAFYRENA